MNNARKVIVIGFGSSVLQDDGLPIWITEQLQALPESRDVTFLTSPVGGLDLIAMLDGFSQAILIDTIRTGHGSPGDVYHYVFPDFSETYHLSSQHDVSFHQALELSKTLGYRLPDEIHIFAVEISENMHLEQNFSEPIRAKLDRILHDVVKMVRSVVH